MIICGNQYNLFVRITEDSVFAIEILEFELVNNLGFRWLERFELSFTYWYFYLIILNKASFTSYILLTEDKIFSNIFKYMDSLGMQAWSS